jgi:hypothetical protein
MAASSGAPGEKEERRGRREKKEGGSKRDSGGASYPLAQDVGSGTHPCGRSMASTVTRTSVPGWRKKIRWKFCKNTPRLWGFS